LAGASLDIQELTGAKPEEAVGFIQGVQTASRITKTAAIAQALPPALASSMVAGGSARDSAALFAALTQGAADFIGESSRTATISLASQLKEFLPDMLSTESRIGVRQHGPTLREKFVADKSTVVIPDDMKTSLAQAVIETILLRGGFYAGRKFRAGGFQVVWWIEKNVVEVFDQDGQNLETIDLEQKLEKTA
jgi:hypothetical protein